MTKTMLIFSNFLKSSFLFIIITLVILPFRYANALTCNVEPQKVSITFGYNGANLIINGSCANSSDLAISIRNPQQHISLKYKDKVGGLFWMKKDQIIFKGLPTVYLLLTTKKLHDLLSKNDLDKYQLGYDALIKQAEVVDTKGTKVDNKWLQEFLIYKKDEKMYHIQPAAIIKQSGDKESTYQVSVHFPYQAKPGNYVVEAFEINAAKVIDRVSANITIEQSGAVSLLSQVAFEHSALYGIIAIAIAIIAGFVVGTIFKKGNEGSH